MTKLEYLNQIRGLLKALPPKEREASLAFYAESIDDRVEEGMCEAEAVASMESPQEAANSILLNAPLRTLVKARAKNRRKLGVFEILLLMLGAPLWLPLLLTAGVLMLTFYLLVWVLVLVFAVVILSFAVSAIACIVVGIASLGASGVPMLLLALGAALVLAGLAVLLLPLLRMAARGAVSSGKAMVKWLKSLLIRKEETT